VRLPERIEDGELLLRRWRVEDAELQAAAVLESIEHLRPWMPWAAGEPQSLAARRATIAGWVRDWEAGGDVYLAIVVGGRVAGGTGLHRRGGPGVLEIGYWLHPDFVGRGVATRTARLLTDAAFALDGIDRVQIRHDHANARSGAVPARLGFSVLRDAPNPAPAPGDVGTDRTWSVTRADWSVVSSKP
jgi:ribosomal-protein-serine acetyltransferase